MTLLEVLALVSATAAFSVALLVFAFARAPGWQPQRRFSAVSFTAGLYASCSFVTLGNVAPSLVVPFVELQMVVAAAHIVAWSYYADAFLQELSRRLQRWVMSLCAAASVLVFWPGFCFTGEIRTWVLGDTGIIYTDPVTTPWANIVFGIVGCGFAYVGMRFVQAARRGHPRALLHAVCIAAMLLMAASDAVTASGLLHLPYLLDAGFILPVGFVAYELVVRFGEDARSLEELRTRLEALVVERTSALDASQQALARADALAALGRVAASVAHEVNNPTAAVLGNLEYLGDSLRRSGTLPSDAEECLHDCEQATRKIAKIARQLLDSSRFTIDQRVAKSPIALVNSVQESARLARPRLPSGVDLHVDVSPTLWVSAQHEGLVQVLVNLLVNSAEAIAESKQGSYVKILANISAEHVRIVVEDDGPGMSPTVLSRAFEPFFTTKPIGRGTGLGLAVSRGLVSSMGGQLLLESQPGQGTRAIVELLSAPRAADDEAGEAVPLPPAQKLSILLVDDDPEILVSVGRLLGECHRLERAASVDEALEKIYKESNFDIIVADVVMPDGGARRLYELLVSADPELSRRFVFFTAGATDEATREYLQHQTQPVLYKPLDRGTFARVIERITASPAGGAPLLAAQGE